MPVTLTLNHVSRTLSIRLDVIDAEPLRPDYKNGTFSPQGLHLKFFRANDADWSLSEWESKAYGPMLKKDGSLGQNTGEKRIAGDLPQWIHDAVETYRPVI